MNTDELRPSLWAIAAWLLFGLLVAAAIIGAEATGWGRSGTGPAD